MSAHIVLASSISAACVSAGRASGFGTATADGSRPRRIPRRVTGSQWDIVPEPRVTLTIRPRTGRESSWASSSHGRRASSEGAIRRTASAGRRRRRVCSSILPGGYRYRILDRVHLGYAWTSLTRNGAAGATSSSIERKSGRALQVGNRRRRQSLRLNFP